MVLIPAGLAAVGLLLFGVAACSGGGLSPRSYVAGHYQRAPGRDVAGAAQAYTSGRPPTAVALELTRAWAPAGRYTDGSGVYLRYAADAVVLRPDGGGTLILVEPVGSAYRRYAGSLGDSGWSNRNGG
ncbi:DUF4247 domain-containing protein [Dactylosporangium matsuzakiense]|uniref:Uncharacterized protein n=1 Tax=Dactylosporangium matsuzakiense TaxID=53360 RepID=A0A9W6KUR1_9ACTN|nr:DUF4247 domain-containing protein [Dactylosporangium matsuzakiense]GLL08033.1 hypothetical protein GCM10017581_097930 [Dactylosporangium matsuzakiense]